MGRGCAPNEWVGTSLRDSRGNGYITGVLRFRRSAHPKARETRASIALRTTLDTVEITRACPIRSRRECSFRFFLTASHLSSVLVRISPMKTVEHAENDVETFVRRGRN